MITKSQLSGRIFLWFLNNSLKTLLARLRLTAFPSRLVAIIPILLSVVGLSLSISTCAKKWLVRTRFPFCLTVWNSSRLLMRFLDLKPKPQLLTDFCLKLAISSGSDAPQNRLNAYVLYADDSLGYCGQHSYCCVCEIRTCGLDELWTGYM